MVGVVHDARPHRDEADDERPGGDNTDHRRERREDETPVAGGHEAADQQRLAVQSPARGGPRPARATSHATTPQRPSRKRVVPQFRSPLGGAPVGVEPEPRSDKLTASSARFHVERHRGPERRGSRACPAGRNGNRRQGVLLGLPGQGNTSMTTRLEAWLPTAWPRGVPASRPIRRDASSTHNCYASRRAFISATASAGTASSSLADRGMDRSRSSSPHENESVASPLSAQSATCRSESHVRSGVTPTSSSAGVS